MLEANIILPIDNTEWIHSMVIQHKMLGFLRIYVEFFELNTTCKHDPFPKPFTKETLENMASKEVYSFTYDLSRYHQV